MRPFLKQIIARPDTHALWLNTLSYLENCGARRLSAIEHPTKVKEEMLKHASEEFRHAHHLKKQIAKIISSPLFEDYSQILGGCATWHYLPKLELLLSRQLLKHYPYPIMKERAYLLVTYAIEKRAQIIYPLYHTLLKEAHSPITVKSILLEEEEHLEEVEKELADLQVPIHLKQEAVEIEGILFQRWFNQVAAAKFEFL